MKKQNKRAQQPRVKKPQAAPKRQRIPLAEAIDAAKLYSAMALASGFIGEQSEGETKAMFLQAQRLAMTLVNELEKARPGAITGMDQAIGLLKSADKGVANEQEAVVAE